jgi:hypothetical protein
MFIEDMSGKITWDFFQTDSNFYYVQEITNPFPLHTPKKLFCSLEFTNQMEKPYPHDVRKVNNREFYFQMEVLEATQDAESTYAYR